MKVNGKVYFSPIENVPPIVHKIGKNKRHNGQKFVVKTGFLDHVKLEGAHISIVFSSTSCCWKRHVHASELLSGLGEN